MEQWIYLENKQDAELYYKLLTANKVKFRLRPYIRGFVFILDKVDN